MLSGSNFLGSLVIEKISENIIKLQINIFRCVCILHRGDIIQDHFKAWMPNIYLDRQRILAFILCGGEASIISNNNA